MGSANEVLHMRIDRLLWRLRLAKTRGLAQAIVAGGHLRINGARVLRASREARAGDVLTIPLGSGVRVIELLGLPARRGPASEASACYRALDERGESTIAAANTPTPERGSDQ